MICWAISSGIAWNQAQSLVYLQHLNKWLLNYDVKEICLRSENNLKFSSLTPELDILAKPDELAH